MPERLSSKLRDYLAISQGKDVDIREIRIYLQIEPGSNDDDNLRKLMSGSMTTEKIVRPSGRKDGIYKVITPVRPVTVFGRERQDEVRLMFPKDYGTGLEMSFAEDIIFREGDLILLSGQSNQGKTALCLNFCAENLDSFPVLMGNEYTTIEQEPAPRLLNRLDSMNWVNWINGDGEERFTLLPVWDDYAEHVVKDRLNIIDWINLDEHYEISKVMAGIKRELGRGLGIIAIQKAAGASAGRGGQFTKDFADCELLLDAHGDSEVRLTVGKVKEPKSKVMGRSFAYGISKGVRLVNFRELAKCESCYGKGWTKQGPCSSCGHKGFVDK